MSARFSFDPVRVAHLEAAAWRAYYYKAWGKLLYLTERACAEQFGVPFPRWAEAAYYATRGAIAFKPVRNDLASALASCERYYRILRYSSGLRFDPAAVAPLELRYWEVHRGLSGADDHRELLDTFADLHVAIFAIAHEAALESARWRTRAAITVDGITARRSTDIAGDWRRAEAELRVCYRLVLEAIRVV